MGLLGKPPLLGDRRSKGCTACLPTACVVKFVHAVRSRGVVRYSTGT